MEAYENSDSIQNKSSIEQNEFSTVVQELKPKQRRFLFFGSIIYSIILANFVIWSGFSLGFFLAVLIGQIGLYIVIPKPSSGKIIVFTAFLSLCITGLGLSYLLYSDVVLGVINFLVIIFLLLLQVSLYSQALTLDWDQPGYYVALLIAPFVRPFIALHMLGSVAKAASTTQKKAKVVEPTHQYIIGKILIGLLIAIPFLIVIIALLSSADVIFGNYAKDLLKLIANIRVGEYMISLIIAVIVFPFLFSFLCSYQNRWRSKWIAKSFPTKQEIPMLGDPIIAGTVLVLLNLVYSLFAWVQFGYLFEAFKAVLPQNLTFAEYARQGFFQLSVVAFINILVVVVSVLFIKRGSIAGVVVRIMAVLLIFFTWMLLASAGFRMKMYIDSYALSKLRLLVSIFMLMIGLILLYALFKEFFKKFKFLKATIITAVLFLLFTNFLNTNALIARYNIDQYQTKVNATSQFASQPQIDWKYLLYDLSDDAIPVITELTNAKDTRLANKVKTALKDQYDSGLEDYRKNNWKKYNIGKEQAKKCIEQSLKLNSFGNLQEIP